MDRKESYASVFSIAILGTILLIVTNGMTFTGITVFDEAIIDEFGWSKSQLKFRDFVNLVTASFLMPFVGAAIDKFGVKRMMVLGLVIISGLLYAYSFVQATFHMYAIHFAFALAVSGAGTLATVIMVSQRVKKRRGTAIGIALAGTSAGGMIIPQIGGWLLENYGWRGAFQYEAVIPLVIAVILFFFLKPIRYKDKAGEKSKPGQPDADTGLTEIQFRDALRMPVFWAISLAGIFCFYSIMGIISNLFLYLRELDFSMAAAQNTFTIFFGLILVAKLTSGVVTEFISEHKLFKIQLALMTVGAVGMALNTATMVWPSLIAVGLGWGGLYTLFNYIIITTFGVKSAGKIGGVISVFEGVGAGVGSWLTGLISDQTGSYSASFWVVVVLLGIAFLISFFIRPVDKGEDKVVSGEIAVA